MEIKVEGMSCQHCVKSVTEAVQSVAKAASVEVDLTSGMVSIENAEDGQKGAIEGAIQDQGYEIAAG
ncbi:MAG: heavy-metal-associated domain-containing protein [Leptospiraceae bacterium]|nr:heavy-metal-associated domain-containing protein [Leptospiraceae bacterium]